MKKTKILQTLLMLLTMMWVTSCNQADNHDFEEYYGSDNVILCAFNLYEIMDNAGVEFADGKVVLPKGIKRMIPHRGEVVDDVLSSIKGVDPRKVVLVADEDKYMYALVKLLDPKDFEKSVRDYADKTVDGEYTILKVNNLECIIDGNMLLAVVEADAHGAELMEQIKSNASKAPAKDWQKKLINDGKTLNMMVSYDAVLQKQPASEIRELNQVLASMFEGGIDDTYIVISCQLDGLQLKSESKLYASDGSAKRCKWFADKVDRDMLKYTSSNDLMVALFAFTGSQWKDLIDQLIKEEMPEEQCQQLRSLYADLGGEFMLSVGYSRLSEVIQHNYSSLNVTLAASVDGNAAAKLKQIEQLLGQYNMPYSNQDGKLMITLPNIGMGISVIADGDNIVITTADAFSPKDCPVKLIGAADDSVDYTLSIPGDNSAITLTPLPFGVDYSCNYDGECSTTVIRLTDTEGKLLENVINFASKF